MVGSMHSGGYAGLGACMVEGMHGGGCMVGDCMVGGMHGGGHAWWGECVVGGMHGGGCQGIMLKFGGSTCMHVYVCLYVCHCIFLGINPCVILHHDFVLIV